MYSMAGHRQISANKANHKLLGLVVLFLIIASSAGYFLEVNSAASLDYEVKSYQKNIDKLKNDSQKMKVIIAETVSLSRMGEDAEAEKLNLVSAADYQYLPISLSSLAKR